MRPEVEEWVNKIYEKIKDEPREPMTPEKRKEIDDWLDSIYEKLKKKGEIT